jgi:flavin reductase (DIM6/NTAB) family NADH-FMN oxidoreductase RutF
MKEALDVIETTDIRDNTFQLIDKEWMLVTAGPLVDFNTMTASWGGFGSLWGRHVVFTFIRPERYTYQFMEQAENFTLTFFAPQYHDALMFCGTHSGRDVDKMEATGLTPVAGPADTVYFAEARLVLFCRKIYAQDLEGACFTVPEIDEAIYSNAAYHRLYIGDVTRCLRKPGN